MPRSASLIDLDALPAEVRWQVECALDSAQRAYNHDAWMRDRCQNTTDAELIAAGEKEYPEAPMGLSTWYKSVALAQETIFCRVSQTARRPVFMRGSRNVLHRLYSLSNSANANGWAIEVYWRALRMSRRTFLSFDEFQEWSDNVKACLHRKYRLTSSFCNGVGIWARDWNPRSDEESAVRIVGGKRVYLPASSHKHLDALAKIVRKTETLERKRELVRAQLMERLAA